MTLPDRTALSRAGWAHKTGTQNAASKDPNVRGPGLAEVESDAALSVFVSLVQHGESMRDAARRSGISPDAVLEWLERDPSVLGEMKAAEAVISKQVRFRLLSLANSAVDAISAALDRGDAEVAIEVLQALGLTRGLSDFRAGGEDSESNPE